MKRYLRPLVSALLAVLLVCVCCLPCFAAVPQSVAAREQENALVRRIAQEKEAYMKQENERVRAALKERGIPLDCNVGELRTSSNEAAKDLYRDIYTWLVEETEDSSVLAYSQFVSAKSIAGLDLSTVISWSSLQDFADTVLPELLRLLGLEQRWKLLDQNKIVNYAHKYALKYNPAYRVPDSGSDCTNFVSQALYAGGLSMNPSSIRGTSPGTKTTTSEWYYYNSPSATKKTAYEKAVAVSTSWVRVADLYTYLAPHFETLTTTDTREVTRNLKEGYVIQGGPLVGRYEHSAIVTKKNGHWAYTAHTNDRKDRAIKHYYNAYERFRLIKVC